MRWTWRSAQPYAAALGGVAAITVLIAALRPWLDLPNLTVAYLLLVLWLGARYGWPPAVSAALLAFLAYDWFFVPPFGTLWISAPRELLNLVVLMAAALAGGRLASSLAAREAGAAAEAEESGTLYELAIAALREPVGSAALSLLCERAVTSGGVSAMSLVAEGTGGVEVVAGAPLSEAALAGARSALATERNVGARLHAGQLELIRTYPAQPGPACVLLPGGVAVMRPPERRPSTGSRRQLAALLGLAGLRSRTARSCGRCGATTRWATPTTPATSWRRSGASWAMTRPSRATSSTSPAWATGSPCPPPPMATAAVQV
jgi:hypothetical protein